MPKEKKLPDTIFVVRRSERDSPNGYLIADVEHTLFQDGENVGKYKLVSTGIKQITHTVKE